MKKTIFVSIASYRDKVCGSTVESLYKNAKYPLNVFVGICQQNSPDDQDCLAGIDPAIPLQNIRIMRIPHTEAQGPCKARYLCSTLYKDEDFYMQIDSHTRFVSEWDVKAIGMIERIKQEHLSNKPVLSGYPASFEDYNSSERHVVPRICKANFNDRDMITFSAAQYIDTKGKFYRSPFIAAGMFFTQGDFLKEVPFDPDLPYLFTGEEILLSIRFFTNGMDIFTPSENLVFHEYTRNDAPKFWNDIKYSDTEAHEKVKKYINSTINPLPKELASYMEKCEMALIKSGGCKNYGLGKARTLQEFYDFSGINPKNKTESIDFCSSALEPAKPIIDNIIETYIEMKQDKNIYKYIGIGMGIVIIILLTIFKD